MKRKNFIQHAAITTAALVTGKLSFGSPKPAVKKEIYEWREYEIHFGGSQNALHEYL